MQISDILMPERIFCHIKVNSKKAVLEHLSQLLAKESPSLTSHDIFDSFFERERLGSTGIGKGVAIPHARVAQCNVTSGAFFQLEKAIDFDAIDQQPVDLLFALMVPEQSTEEHLKILAQLAYLFSKDRFCEKLRNTQECSDKFGLLTHWQPPPDLL